MKAKSPSERSHALAKRASASTKTSRRMPGHPATQADDDPDAAVLIDPCYLVEHHGISKKVAHKIAKSALDSCSKRWRRAEVRIADDEVDYSHTFIHIGYMSKISRHDVDMEASNESGPALKAEIHDYLLIRACEEVGVRPPTFQAAKTLDPMQELSARWNGANVTDEYHRLATSAAKYAALLTGLRAFDRVAMAMSVSKAKHSKFKKALSASLDKFMTLIPELGSNGRRIVLNLEMETSGAIVSSNDDMIENAIRAYAALACSDSIEGFARAYVFVLSGI